MTDNIPIALLELKDRLALRWIDAAGADFTLPFFRDTVCNQIRLGKAQSLTSENELTKLRRCPSPTAFIFHMSRCGSTLTSRMLSAVSRFHVISEPAPINQILSLDGVTESRREVLLDGLINAFVAGERHSKQAYFIKLTSWNAFYIPLFQKMYPETPWVFIYREPTEVLASQDKAPSSWSTKERLAKLCIRLGIPIDLAASRMEQVAVVLAGICKHAVKHFNPARSLFLNYDCLRTDVCRTIGEFLRLELSEGDVAAMRAVSLYHAKNIQQRWETERTTTADSNAARATAEKFLIPIYEQLNRCKTMGAY